MSVHANAKTLKIPIREDLKKEKKLLAKNDLHVMKRILYDTGRRTVARWSHKRG